MIMNETIFVVDDNSANLVKAEYALGKRYLVITMSSAEKMFAILRRIIPDLILLDIEMPEMDGYEAIRRLKACELYAKIPVILLTATTERQAEAKGIKLGAVDFIAKPYSEQVLINRINNYLQIDKQIRERTTQLSELIEQLATLQNSVVYTLASVVEGRDKYTEGHINRTTEYIRILTDAMLERGLYVEEMRGWDFESIVSSASLHDIGKIKSPESILNKPGKLSYEEFSVIKTHPITGQLVIDQMIEKAGDQDFLVNAKLFAAYHHEKWDGTGYPYGLKETRIPIHGRIMGLVDAYDALTSERPYKKAFSGDEAMYIVNNNAGKHFDPFLADVFNIVKEKLELVPRCCDTP